MKYTDRRFNIEKCRKKCVSSLQAFDVQTESFFFIKVEEIKKIRGGHFIESTRHTGRTSQPWMFHNAARLMEEGVAGQGGVPDGYT